MKERAKVHQSIERTPKRYTEEHRSANRIRLRSVREPAPYMPEFKASGGQCADNETNDEEHGENKQSNQRQIAQPAIRFRHELDVCGQRREDRISCSRGNSVALKSTEGSNHLLYERPIIHAADSGENAECRQSDADDHAAKIRHCRD